MKSIITPKQVVETRPIVPLKQMTATRPNLVPRPSQMPITKPVTAKPGISQPTEPTESNKSIIPEPISTPAFLTKNKK